MAIEVSNLTKIYGQKKAIDNISFKIDKAAISRKENKGAKTQRFFCGLINFAPLRDPNQFP